MKSAKYAVALLLSLSLALPAVAGDVKDFKGSVEGTSAGAVLFGALVERLDPDSMEMVLDEEPSEDGKVRHMYLEIKGAHFGSFRLDEMSLETMFNKFNPVAEWSDPEKISVENIMAGNFSATVCEADINKALSEKIDENWKNVQVDIKPEGLFARGYYVVKGSVSLKILVELSTGLEVRSRKIWLNNYKLFVNNAEKTSIVKDAVKDLQPVVDLEDFVFPLNVDRIEMGSDTIRLVTKTAPKPFAGVMFKYNR
ncbi:MAG: hypothetical protein Q7I97_09825 [Thermovirgaceae bacterium]|nr:hypothetical protein [Thermovirgaceae bacterium]